MNSRGLRQASPGCRALQADPVQTRYPAWAGTIFLQVRHSPENWFRFMRSGIPHRRSGCQALGNPTPLCTPRTGLDCPPKGDPLYTYYYYYYYYL